MVEQAAGVPGDYVLVTLPGVQRFLSESRSTADLHSASRIVSLLAGAMYDAVGAVCPDARVVVPAVGGNGPGGTVPEREGRRGGSPYGEGRAAAGLPNRVVVLTPPGRGGEVARAVSDAAVAAWDRLLVTLRLGGGAGSTPGFPAPRWVVAEPSGGGYLDQATRGARALDERKRIRDFPLYVVDGRPVCTLSGRWAARDDAGRVDEALSVVADAKRRFRDWSGSGVGAFPSTASVASAVFRAEVAGLAAGNREICAAVGELRAAVGTLRDRYGVAAGASAVPGVRRRAADGSDEGRWLARVDGGWCYPHSWAAEALVRDHELTRLPEEELCAAGEAAAARLTVLAGRAGVGRPSRYLAVVVQDADWMGRRLAVPPPAARADPLGWHHAVSAALVDAAADQSARLESPEVCGRAVYAGGDDLLGFVPVACALTAAVEVNGAFTRSLAGVLPGGTASVAVVFFHVSGSLQAVVETAQTLLKDAKRATRPGFGVAVLRRGGQRARAVLPWQVKLTDGGLVPAPVVVGELAGALRGGLSGRLAAGLERDRDEIADLPPRWRAREIRRLIGRHGGTERIADLLSEYVTRAGGADAAVEVALVAHFLAAEVGYAPGAGAVSGADQAAGEADPAAVAVP
jgi:CRISPR-associated protein Cmr2